MNKLYIAIQLTMGIASFIFWNDHRAEKKLLETRIKYLEHRIAQLERIAGRHIQPCPEETLSLIYDALEEGFDRD